MMQYKKNILILMGCVALLTGCASVHKNLSYGSKHKVTQYSGGKVVNEWISNGKVLSEKGSDGYYFKTVSGKYIEASGTLVIERIDL